MSPSPSEARRTEGFEVNYAAVLADLLARRSQVDSAIAAIKSLMNANSMIAIPEIKQSSRDRKQPKP